MPRPFQVALDLNQRRCLVVGSSSECAPRVRSLLAAGARVTLVSERADASLEELARTGSITVERRAFREADLDDMWLAVLADRDAELAERMGRAAEGRRVLFCAIDQPGHNSFAHQALVHAGSLSVAISTAGRAPALARRLRQELDRLFREAGLGAFVLGLAELRERTPPDQRRELLGQLVSGVRLSGQLELPKLPELPG
jgi:siroheme synthase-like protein